MLFSGSNRRHIHFSPQPWKWDLYCARSYYLHVCHCILCELYHHACCRPRVTVLEGRIYSRPVDHGSSPRTDCQRLRPALHLLGTHLHSISLAAAGHCRQYELVASSIYQCHGHCHDSLVYMGKEELAWPERESCRNCFARLLNRTVIPVIGTVYKSREVSPGRKWIITGSLEVWSVLFIA